MSPGELRQDGVSPRGYGACDTQSILNARSRLPGVNGKEERRHPSNSNRESSTQVAFHSPDGVNASVVRRLEDIFSRASEGMGLYEQLGGLRGIASALDTDPERGLHSDSVEARREAFGKNELPKDAPLTFWQIYRATWGDNMIRILALAAVISLVLGLTVPDPGETKVDYHTAWIEGFAIICSILIVTTVSSVNDYQKEKKFQRLTEENVRQPIRVIRDGAATTIDVSEIVVGDVVSLSPGLVVPVDGFYISGLSVVVDESSVTGENDPRPKSGRAPVLLSGTVVNTAEEAYFLAAAVGERSFGGKLLAESSGDGTEVSSMTPLQERLDDLASQVGRVGLTLAGVLFVILCMMEGVRLARHDPSASAKHFLDHFLICVTLVVIVVPEGLPLAVTIALAYSQSKMHDDHNQVRRLRACETMGNATQICSDKTGTLTQNQMSVVQGYVGMCYFAVTRPGDLPEPIPLPGVPADARDLLLEALAVNSSSERVWDAASPASATTSHAPPHPETAGGVWRWATDRGNKTDNALLDFVDRVLLAEVEGQPTAERPHQRLRRARRAGGFAVFPFTSDRKRMTSVVRAGAGQGWVQHVKGGSDQVLHLCDRFLNEAGVERPLDEAARRTIAGQIRQFADGANRTIGVAYARLDEERTAPPTEEPTAPLVWLGLIGIQDPLRPEVAEAVRKCQMAGITVRMCTGDNLDTAVAIARQCGIFTRAHGDLAMTGRDFRELVYDTYGDASRMQQFWSVLDRMTVMARSQPLDKQLLVLMLMSRGDVVAVTGDGTNDAPALHLANVGFVMRSGTDIAVKSADIVLLDDNFRSVQRAVVWGRCVNDNIRKFLQFQLTINYVAVALVFIGSLVAQGRSSPLSTTQLLWLNLIMDTLAALALATEQPSESCLRRPPINRGEPLISMRMHLTTGVATAFILTVALGVRYLPERWLNLGTHGTRLNQTIIFNVIVVCTIAHMLSCRKLYDERNPFEGFRRSLPCLAVMGLCLGFQALAVQTFGEFMQVTPLNLRQWILSLVPAPVLVGLTVLSRFVPLRGLGYRSRFDAAALDSDARRALDQLTVTVAKAREDAAYRSGRCLEDAIRLRARALWQKAHQHHIRGGRIVKLFRRNRAERQGMEQKSQ